ncbi:hypothetical protein PCE1_002353 [Barthelona sp. PCE]
MDFEFLKLWVEYIAIAEFNDLVGNTVVASLPTMTESVSSCVGGLSFPDSQALSTISPNSSISTLNFVWRTELDDGILKDTFFGFCTFISYFASSEARNFKQETVIFITKHFSPIFLDITACLVKFLIDFPRDDFSIFLECVAMSFMECTQPRLGNKYILRIFTDEFEFVLKSIPPYLRRLSEQHINGPMQLPGFFLYGDDSDLFLEKQIPFLPPSFSVEPYLTPIVPLLASIYVALLRGLSIIIHGCNPHNVSMAVISLVALLQPLPYGGLVRPYLTVAHKLVSSDSTLPAGVYGCTDPIIPMTVKSHLVVDIEEGELQTSIKLESLSGWRKISKKIQKKKVDVHDTLLQFFNEQSVLILKHFAALFGVEQRKNFTHNTFDDRHFPKIGKKSPKLVQAFGSTVNYQALHSLAAEVFDIEMEKSFVYALKECDINKETEGLEDLELVDLLCRYKPLILTQLSKRQYDAHNEFFLNILLEHEEVIIEKLSDNLRHSVEIARERRNERFDQNNQTN